MSILPVLDVLCGHVVRGVAGRRAEYRPIVSLLSSSSQPIAIARGLRQRFGFEQFYLADLDAVGGARPTQSMYEELQQDGFRLWVDAGVRTLHDALDAVAADVARVVVGLETVNGPETLRSIVGALGTDRVVFSLDLLGGNPLTSSVEWESRDAWTIAQQALDAGIMRLIVLDLSRVGIGTGVGTEALCTRLRENYPYLEITAGGGVRGPVDVERMRASGVDHVLVASALHDGRLTSADVARCESC